MVVVVVDVDGVADQLLLLHMCLKAEQRTDQNVTNRVIVRKGNQILL